MSDKEDCPGCGHYGSGVLRALEDEVRMPCCGLSWAAANEIRTIRAVKANEVVTKAAEEAIKRAEKAEREAAHLRTQLREIAAVANRKPLDPREDW